MSANHLVKAFFTLTILTCFHSSWGQSLKDGLYKVVREIPVTETDISKDQTAGRAVVKCTEELVINNDSAFFAVELEVDDYVPLILGKKVDTELQDNGKQHLNLSLSKGASDKLETFSTKHLNQRVAIVIDNEVISMHSFKVPIIGGKLQISWCGPEMCEMLMVKLENNVDDH